MKRTFYLKIFNYYCSLTINDTSLIDYFQKEYFLTDKYHKSRYGVTVFKKNHSYNFSAKNIQKKITIVDKKMDLKYVDFLIMVFIGLQTIFDDIYIAHASTIEKDCQAYLFFGRPGAGKSTITSKIEKDKLLSDDTAFITFMKNKSYTCHSPLDRKHLLKQKDTSIPISRIFLVNQAKTNKISTLDFQRKFKALIESDTYWYIFRLNLASKKFKKKIYKVIFKILNSTTIKKLDFKKDFNPALSPI